jgi:hypothetical protein
MRGLDSVKSQTKSVVAAAVLSAAMLAFLGDATAKDTGNVVVRGKSARRVSSMSKS